MVDFGNIENPQRGINSEEYLRDGTKGPDPDAKERPVGGAGRSELSEER
jgi:hypothetical protein